MTDSIDTISMEVNTCRWQRGSANQRESFSLKRSEASKNARLVAADNA